ncbi:MAG: carbohydrate ABC transporter permease, partial [Clostridiales bacterium]|nr:carbohydrate ABC transporter permease [Clostridiales bacterium]
MKTGRYGLSARFPFLRRGRARKIKRFSGGELAAYIIAFIIMGAVAVSYILAFLWAATAATKTHTEIVMRPFSLHKVWHFENYVNAFRDLSVKGIGMWGMILNSLWYMIGGAAIGLFGLTLMAYAIVRFRFVGRKVLIGINYVIITLPILGALPAQYRMMANLGLTNSPLFLAQFWGGFGATMLIIQSVFRGLTDGYREAALIDGAGEYRILFGIMLPLVRAPMTALFVLQTVGLWNDYLIPLLYLPDLPTLSTGIYMFSQTMVFHARMDTLMAATVLSSLPPIVLYVIFNKSMLNSLTIGGLKE